jgi:hypothetical protein
VDREKLSKVQRANEDAEASRRPFFRFFSSLFVPAFEESAALLREP